MKKKMMNKKENNMLGNFPEEEVVCPHCASNRVLSAANRDLDEGTFFCPDGCGVIDEVITGQEFCDRESWET